MAGFDGVEDGEAGASLSLADALPYPITLAAWVPYTAQSGTLKWADGKGREALDPGGNQNDVQILGAFCNRQTGTGRGLTLSPFLETAFAAVRSGLAARPQGTDLTESSALPNPVTPLLFSFFQLPPFFPSTASSMW